MMSICHKCSYRQPACAGPCACTIDGRDIIDHARNGDCPKGYFDHPPQPQPLSDEAKLIQLIDAEPEGHLGDHVKAAIEALGLDRAAKFFKLIDGKNCGCEKRRQWLNSLDASARAWLAKWQR
jgi:hypothetical protein